MQKKLQKVFIEHPSLLEVHHKSGVIKNVHISYVTRTNPLPKKLEEELLKGFEKYVFEYTKSMHKKIINPVELFNSRNSQDNSKRKFFVEIGFGDGENSYKIASNNPLINYLAFDVYLHGLAQYVSYLNSNPLDNVLVARYDAEDFITHSLDNFSTDGFNIFFPDPWLKRKHKKRRLINPSFVSIMCDKLKKGGIIHTSTDIEEYALSMMDIFEENKDLENVYAPCSFAPNMVDRFQTSFETKGFENQRKSYDLVYKKRG